MDHLTSADLITLVIYFSLVVGIGFFASRRKEENTNNYFLGGRNMGWFAIGASLFVTNISAEHFIGLSAAGAVNGLVVGHFEWLAIIAILMLGWIFGPLYYKTGVYTIPEYLERRFNRSSRVYLTTISVVAYILTKISVTLFAGGLLLNAMFGWDIYTSAVVIVVVTGIYTIVGGLRAVMHTHVIQFFFLIGGSALVAIFGLNEVGGFSGLFQRLPESYFDVFRPMGDPDFPWTGVIFGAPIIAIWYWCSDQYIVQRILGAKDISQIKKASVFTSFLKILPVFLFVIPGMVTAALHPDVKSDQVYPFFLAQNLLPAGFYGLFLAGLLAAIMSSLASVFNSTATLFTMDFYRIYNPQATERKLVLIGRLATTLIVISAILWIPLTKMINVQIYIYLQIVQSYIAPPIAAVLIFGLISKTANGKGAIWALFFGGALGGLRLVLELVHNFYSVESIGISWLVDFNFLHFAIFLFFVSTGILFLVSWITRGSDESVIPIEESRLQAKYIFKPISLFRTKKQFNQQH